MKTNNITYEANAVWNWFIMLLLLAFVVLKVAGVTSMTWWWVFSPIWIPLLIAVVLIVLVLIIDGLIKFFRWMF